MVDAETIKKMENAVTDHETAESNCLVVRSSIKQSAAEKKTREPKPKAPPRYALTLVDNETTKTIRKSSGRLDGTGALIMTLRALPLALAERQKARSVDSVHLTRYVGTNYVEWVGRAASGHYVSIGNLMEIIKVGGKGIINDD